MPPTGSAACCIPVHTLVYTAIMQNCAINNMMMANGAHKEHTMTPYATAATQPDPIGPTAATRAHRPAQGARHNVRWAGDRTGTVNLFRC